MSNDTIQQIDEQIKQSKVTLEFGAALDRLYKNRDFKAVIMDGYFRAEAIRLVHLKADPQFQTAERQAAIVGDLDAIGRLSQFFTTTHQLADLAARSIASDEAMREDILANGGDE